MKFPTSILLAFLTASANAEAPRNENTIVLDANAIHNLGIETVAAE